MNKWRYTISLIAVIILQTAVVSNWTFFGISPALSLVYLVALSFLYGPLWGGYTGLAIGLIEDMMFSQVLGIRALLFFIAATAVGKALYHNEHNLATGTLATALVSLFVLAGQWGILFLLRMPLLAMYLIGKPVLFYALFNALLFTPVMILLKRLMRPESIRPFGRL